MKAPRYPSGGGDGRAPLNGSSEAQTASDLFTTSSPTFQVGSGRPEKIKAPPTHLCFRLVDFDVPMHYNHKRTKACVASTVCRPRVGYRDSAIVDVRHRSGAGLVRPIAISAFPIPMKV